MKVLGNDAVYGEKLIDILRSKRIDLREADPLLDAAIGRCIICGFDVYIYGAAKDVDIFARYLLDAGIYLKGIIDRNPSKCGKIIEDIEVISPSAFIDKAKTENQKHIYAFIYPLVQHGGLDEKRITRIMNEAHVADYHYVGMARYSLAGYMPECAILNEGRRSYYKEHISELLETLTMLEDIRSKEIFLEYIRAYVECSYYKFEPLPTRYKYFKDTEGRSIYKTTENEVWINCGADGGSTIANYYLCGLTARKIYAIDESAEALNNLTEYLKYFPKELRDAIHPIQIHIDEDSQNELRGYMDPDSKVTLINADIEGAELSMLKGIRQLIIKDRPVIAICVYHRKEDLINIPEYIRSIADDYHFILRKYASWIQGDSGRFFELVLYAIPKERML